MKIETAISSKGSSSAQNNCFSLNANQLAERINKKYDVTRRCKGGWRRAPGKCSPSGNGYIDNGEWKNGRGEKRNYPDEIKAMRNDGWNVTDDFLKKHSWTGWVFWDYSYFDAFDYAKWHIAQYDKNGDGNLQRDESPGAFEKLGI